MSVLNPVRQTLCQQKVPLKASHLQNEVQPHGIKLFAVVWIAHLEKSRNFVD